MNIGIIAEDDSDVAVLREVTLTLLKTRAIGFKKFVGGGCGKLRRKCGAWASNLVQRECPWLVVVHDLDIHDESELRTQLEASIAPAGSSASVVLIPKREIEAWLLYDGKAIAAAFRERQPPQLPGNPEALIDPKKYLRDLIRRKYRKEYIYTIYNAHIAKHINTSTLRRSRSFAPHFGFAAAIKTMLG